MVNCGVCGKQMVIVGDTPLCQDCNKDEIFEFNAFIKHDIKEVNEK